ncbi:hypothetical protein EGO53_28455 (plasmid) [Serratia liquefaciens]|uniref:Uncharacterized protein n=1 Tax=Serratia liquefaciens TaxID=614 RepID=A0A515D5N7_SERLI|nr:hypothetical protein EGO53_28455 [Serratia liquefaciens]
MLIIPPDIRSVDKAELPTLHGISDLGQTLACPLAPQMHARVVLRKLMGHMKCDPLQDQCIPGRPHGLSLFSSPPNQHRGQAPVTRDNALVKELVLT